MEIKYLLHAANNRDYEVVFDDEVEAPNSAAHFEEAVLGSRPFYCLKWRYLDLFGRSDYNEEDEPLVINPAYVVSFHRQGTF